MTDPCPCPRPRFVVLECDQCDMPMAVWRAHTMVRVPGSVTFEVRVSIKVHKPQSNAKPNLVRLYQ